MAAIRDSLDAFASCTLPEVPLHWRYSYSWGLDLSGLAGQRAAGAQRAAGTQGAAGFSPRGPSDGATAGIHDTGGISTSPERERAGSGMGVAPGVSPVSGIHGAGGIGGLLAVEAPQSEGDPLRHWYFYDSNGNVGQLLAYDATGPTVNAAPAAKYEYGPYGQTLTVHDADSSGYAAANPLRFSTKWFDAETGLGYWGYRYYSPDLGRWMNRDPIGESGGRNLFLYVDNRPTNAFDALGLERCCSDAWFDANKPVPPPPTGQTTGSIDVGGHYSIFGIWVAIGSYSDTWTGRWIKLYDKTANRCGTSGTVKTKIVFTYDSGVKTTSTLSASSQVTQAVQSVKASVQSGYSFSLETSNAVSITDEDNLELKACTYRRYQKWQLIEEHGITGSGTLFVQWTSLGSLRPAGTFSVSAGYMRYTTNFFVRDCEWSCRKSSGCSSN